MKKFLPHILIAVVLVSVGILLPTKVTYAVWYNPATWISGAFPSVQDLVTGLTANVFTGLLKAISWLLWLSGLLLNYVLDYTVVNMRANIQGMDGINIAWKVIRDLMNIAFIFMLIYAGIRLIIGQEDTGNIKKIISGIILSSLLINFSLFFTKVLIDASNVVTVGFYNIVLDGKTTATGYGLSDPIVDSLGLTTIYGNTTDPDPSLFANESMGQMVIAFFGAATLLIVASFVFFAVAIIFSIRFIVLIILMMLSPIAYMGFALPGIKKYSDQWWESFRGQLLFAPIYMIMTWVILVLMNSQNFLVLSDPSKGFSAALNSMQAPSFSTMGIFLNYALIIGLLIASLVVAKDAASKGNKMIGSWTGKATAFTGGALVGASARLGRNTIGRAGNAVANSEYLKDKQANGNIFTRNLATLAVNRGDRAAKATFDARNTSSYKALESATGVKIGKGADAKKENYRAIREQQEKDAAKAAERYKPNDAAYAEAKAADEKLKAEKTFAADKLNPQSEAGKKFIIQENEEKARYFNSNEWKNTPIGREEASALAAVEAHRKATQDLSNKEKEIEAKMTDASQTQIQERKTQILEEVEAMKKEAAAKQGEIENLKKVADAGEAIITKGKEERDNWKSQSKLRFEALRDRDDEENKKALDKVYQDRVNRVGDRVGHTGDFDTKTNSVLRKVGMVVGSVANTVGITSAPPRTKPEREALARKIKGAPKGKKSAKDLAKDLKNVYGLDIEIEEGGGDKKDDAPKEEGGDEPKSEEGKEESTT